MDMCRFPYCDKLQEVVTHNLFLSLLKTLKGLHFEKMQPHTRAKNTNDMNLCSHANQKPLNEVYQRVLKV